MSAGRTAVREPVALFAILAGLAASCVGERSGPPPIVLDATPCNRCGMLVSELAFAAAVREEGGEAQVYDDIICLLEDRTLPGGEHIWVHDFETLEWIDADTAVFVRSDAVSTPMGGGIVAFSDRRAAVRFADSSGGEVLDTLERLVAAVNEGASP